MAGNKKDILQKLEEELKQAHKEINDLHVDMIDMQMRISLLENTLRRLTAKFYENDN